MMSRTIEKENRTKKPMVTPGLPQVRFMPVDFVQLPITGIASCRGKVIVEFS